MFLIHIQLPELTELRDKKIKQFVATIERFYMSYRLKVLHKLKKISAAKLQQRNHNQYLYIHVLDIRTFYYQKKFNEQRNASSLLNSEIRRKFASQEYKTLRSAALIFQKGIYFINRVSNMIRYS